MRYQTADCLSANAMLLNPAVDAENQACAGPAFLSEVESAPSLVLYFQGELSPFNTLRDQIHEIR